MKSFSSLSFSFYLKNYKIGHVCTCTPLSTFNYVHQYNSILSIYRWMVYIQNVQDFKETYEHTCTCTYVGYSLVSSFDQ